MAKIATFEQQIKYRWILADVWFSEGENMKFIKLVLRKEFVMPIKGNRLVAFSKAEVRENQFRTVSSGNLKADIPQMLYVKGIPFPVLEVKQVFRNEDQSEGAYLVSSDLTAGVEKIKEVYHKRWQVEEYHKSLKSNLGLAKSPTKIVRTQHNHCFACFAVIYVFVKLEILKMRSQANHFALKSSLYLKALKASMGELRTLQSSLAA